MPGEHDRVRAPAAARAGASSASRCSASPPAARRMASGWPAISLRKLSGNFPNDFTSRPGYRRMRPDGSHREGRGDRRRQHLHPRAGRGLRPAGRACCPSRSWCCTTSTQERLDVVGGLAARILGKLGLPGRLTLTTDREAAIEGADFVLVQLRVGGLAARLTDETIPPRFGLHRPGDDRGRAASPRRCARCPWCSTIAEDTARLRRSRRLAARLHEPGRAGHPGADRPRAPRDRALQHPDRLSARARQAARRRARRRCSWSTSASTTCRGSARCWSTARTGCRPDRHLRRPAGRGGRHAGRRWSACCRAIPSYYLRYFYLHVRVVGQAGDGADPGRAR